MRTHHLIRKRVKTPFAGSRRLKALYWADSPPKTIKTTSKTLLARIYKGSKEEINDQALHERSFAGNKTLSPVGDLLFYNI